MTSGERLTEELDELVADLRDVAVAIREARDQLNRVIAEARRIAIRAYQAGMTEVDLARELGVDRAKTIRRWLGKENGAAK
jgi:plasmid maintenance system antidote protein VapI